MVKHIQTIRQQIADELLSVFDQFVGLALKVLTMKRNKFKKYPHHTYFKNTAQKMKFFITDFFSKCDQIRRKLRIWSHLLKKSIMENFIFCTVELHAVLTKKKYLTGRNRAWKNENSVKPFTMITCH